jgi:thioredoxin reductase
VTEAWTDRERAAVTAFGEQVSDGEIGVIEGTVVGLASSTVGARWEVDVATASGSATIRADAVILATGGYVTPRDHLRIDGPRPAGLMTADFAADALRRGWLPARRVVIVGDGRLADALANRCREAGIETLSIVRADAGRSAVERVSAVRGDPRLSGVRVDDAWVDADGLILANALQPTAFLLRGLGIGDDRPGVPMPVDDEGRLPLDGLWAAGTCVVPDVDHAGSLELGRRVGSAAAVVLDRGQAGVGASSDAVPAR